MRELHKDHSDKMSWHVADVCSDDWGIKGAVTVVDKGLVDAIVCDKENVSRLMEQMRQKVADALLPEGGQWLVSSHAAPLERMPFLCPEVAPMCAELDTVEATAKAKKDAIALAIEVAMRTAGIAASRSSGEAGKSDESDAAPEVPRLPRIVRVCGMGGWAEVNVYVAGPSCNLYIYQFVR